MNEDGENCIKMRYLIQIRAARAKLEALGIMAENYQLDG